jgi:hypothetical protein
LYLILVFQLFFILRVQAWSLFWIKLLPPLGWFRVPERMLLMTVFSFSLLFVIWAFGDLNVVEARKRKARFVFWAWRALLIAAVLIRIPVSRWFLEAAPWACVCVWTFFRLSKKDHVHIRREAGIAFLFLMVVASLERTGRFLPAKEIEQVRQVSHEVAAKIPPLERVHWSAPADPFFANEPMALGFSSAEGYDFPLARYNILFSILGGYQPSPGAMNFSLNESSQTFETMRRLYAISGRIVIEQNHLEWQAYPGKVHTAWVPRFLKPTADFEKLAQSLVDSDEKKFYSTAYLMNLEKESDTQCAVESLAVRSPSSGIAEIEAQGLHAGCLVVLPINFSTRLTASSVGADGSTSYLNTFPVDGALLGIQVDQPTKKILVDAPPWFDSTYAALLRIFSFLLAALCWRVCFRREPA